MIVDLRVYVAEDCFPLAPLWFRCPQDRHWHDPAVTVWRCGRCRRGIVLTAYPDNRTRSTGRCDRCGRQVRIEPGPLAGGRRPLGWGS